MKGDQNPLTLDFLSCKGTIFINQSYKKNNNRIMNYQTYLLLKETKKDWV